MSENLFWNLLSKKLSGEATSDDLKKLEVLLREYPHLACSMEQLEHLWKLEDTKSDTYDSELAFQQHFSSMKKQGFFVSKESASLQVPEKVKVGAFKNREKVVAFSLIGICLFAIVSFLTWKGSPDNIIPAHTDNKHFSEVSTKPGSRTKIILPDSTVVWLNAGSKITYNKEFGVLHRNTTLEGEAFFDVKKSKIPFIIHTNSVQVKVLGTTFNVRSYSTEKSTETSLIKGKVEVIVDKRPDLKFILKPNEKLVVANEQETLVGSQNSKKSEPKVVLSSLTFTEDKSIVETSWVDNKFVFQDETFSEIAKRMERWYGVTIEFKNEKVAEERLSGVFTGENIEEALEAMRYTTPFSFSIKSNVITITQ
jgi:ferric-dicitrate binding protein FerR (iron transport regulator)